MIKIVDSPLLEDLRIRALALPRKRLNHNLHATLEDTVHRFCNAVEPGSYVRPHRHPGAQRWELIVALRGHLVVSLFDDEGIVTERVDLSPGGSQIAVEIPGGTWHALASCAPGSALLEIKHGPYVKVDENDFAPWSPHEGDPSALLMERWIRDAKAGDRVPRF